MYRSWQHLIIQNETELQDPDRIRKLIRNDGRVGWVAVIGFFAAGLISLLLAIFLFYQGFELEEKQLSLLLSGAAMIVLSIAFFVGAKLFRQEMNLNPLRNYLKIPGNYQFLKGELENCYYLPGQSRRQDTIVVEGTALDSQGRVFQAREEFSPQIWNFTTPEAERSLQKGSDWYEMKDRRRLLPVPAYFLCNKNRSGLACLIAIDKESVSLKL